MDGSLTKTSSDDTYDETKEQAYLISGIMYLISFFAFFFNAIRLREANVMNDMLEFIIYICFLGAPVSCLVFFTSFEIVDGLQTRELGFFRLKRFLGRCVEMSILLFPFGFLMSFLYFSFSPIFPENYPDILIVLPGLLWVLVLYKLVTNKKTRRFFTRLEKAEW